MNKYETHKTEEETVACKTNLPVNKYDKAKYNK